MRKLVISVAALCFIVPSTIAAEPLHVLMLGGSSGPHRTAEMGDLLSAGLVQSDIEITYTEKLERLTPANLRDFDCLLIYKDDGDLTAEQEAALLEFVRRGGGLVAVHCASHCFRASRKYTELVGGRFLRHGFATFRSRIIDAQHPAMQGLLSFETDDETYVHNELGNDLRVLMTRPEAGGYEPYTWVRREGKGRVFYTALGHDHRTWRRAEFQRLIERGLRWASGRIADDVDLWTSSVPPEPVPTPEEVPLPLSPEESMRHMHLPEGFRVELFAAEPDIICPLAMAFDERGRLWVIESTDYPNNVREPFDGNDRIKICEDTDGDGRADRFTVFAEGLNLPTGLLPARGGVIVALAPHIVFFEDTDGDDVADRREILYTGFGRIDTHAVHANLHYGFDNWIWATVGYSGGDVHAGGSDHRFKQGIIRFKSDGSALEVITSTSNNTWGLGINEQGRVFASTANDEHSVELGVANRYFERVRGWQASGSRGIADHKRIHPITRDVRQVDWHGGYTAASGYEIYTARRFPPEFWNRAALVCEPTGHLLHVDFLVPRGSGYVARDGWNLLASVDPWTAPIAATVGPDGAVWMIDWYNYVVRHNPTPPGYERGRGNAYVTPLRDKKHGRIYRIVYGQATESTPPRLREAGAEELIKALGHDNLWRRLRGQRLLVEGRHAEAVPRLAAIVEDEQSIAAAALHALWAMHGLGALERADDHIVAVVRRALTHDSPAVRQAALEVLPRTVDSAAVILERNLLADADAEVRLAALLALAEMPGSEDTAHAMFSALAEERNAEDRWIALAATAVAAASDLAFLQAVCEPTEGTEVNNALRRAVRVVAEHYARGKPLDSIGHLVALVDAAEAEIAEPLLAGLDAGWPKDAQPRLDESARSVFGNLVERMSPKARLSIIRLARRWGAADSVRDATERLRVALLADVKDSQQGDEARLAAAGQLVALADDTGALAKLLDMLTPQTAPELAAGILLALGETSSEELGGALVERLGQWTPSSRRAALSVLLRRPSWTEALLDAVEHGTIDPSDLSLEHVQQLRRHPKREIVTRAMKLLSGDSRLPSPNRAKILQERLPLADQNGDLTLGRKVFENQCGKCHRFGELGESIGPDLTGIAARPRTEILTDILDPNRSVEGNYRQYTLATTDGRVLSGLITSETRSTLELLDAEAKRHTVLREDVDELFATGQSAMPEGFEQLADAELVSLLDFLTVGGRFMTLSLSRAATVASDRGMFHDADHEVERLVFAAWGPQQVQGIPFHVIDPRDGAVPNCILLHSSNGAVSRRMPRAVSVDCNSPARRVHLLGGVAGWAYPGGQKGSVSMIVRLHYGDGEREDHPLQNGVQMADYIRRVDVPGSELAMMLDGRQLRYLALEPRRNETIERIEFLKGADRTAPLVMAVTVERPE